MILYRIRDAFNRRHQIWEGIEEGFNGKGRQYFEILPIMISSAGSDGIDDTPTTEEEYQINNWIETASETDPIQRPCQLFVWLAVCGWTLNLNIDCGIGDNTTTATTTAKMYHINNPMVLYTRREAFNRWYWIRDRIKYRFNDVANIGWFGWQRVVEYLDCVIDYTDTPTDKVYQLDEGISN